jgi:hypothetical protein
MPVTHLAQQGRQLVRVAMDIADYVVAHFLP